MAPQASATTTSGTENASPPPPPPAGGVASAAPDQKPAAKIAIGSQRDVVTAAMAKPKAVQAAIASPLQLSDPPAKPKIEPEIKSQAGLSDNLDAEIEAIMLDFSMDDVVDSSQTSEQELELRSRLKATVAKVHGEHVFFNLPGQYEGIASLAQFKSPPEIGTEMDVMVRELNKEDGLYELGIPGSSINVSDWEDINEGDVVEAVVTGSNSGGLEATVNKLQGFIPASQIDRFRVENFDDYVGRRLQCVVVEANPEKRKLVISHRGMLERENEAKRRELQESLEVGQLYEGIVTKLMDFGAFVDIGGMEGLIHVSKLSWTRVKHPRDVLSEGQKLKVKIDKYDQESGKLSLSYRDTLEHPWENIQQKYQPNDIVKGRVTKIAQFGAFVELESGIEGLVHISEIDYKRVVAVKNYVNEGDEVEVKILSIDPENNKMSLSMKATQAPPKPAAQVKAEEEQEDVPLREQIVPKHSGPLKGGRDRESGGEQFGLKW
jgi:small subunit ribosomal protein S1